MKAKYRKFVIGRGKYSFWLRLKQESTTTLKDRSKATTITQRRKHAEADYYHSQRRKNKKFKEVLLGFSKALEKINFLKDDNES